MEKNPMRFEHPKRVEELNIVENLKRAGIKRDSVVCDYGAGTGIVTVEAAKLTANKVYAFDVNAQMLELIKEKIKQLDLVNVELKQVSKDVVELPNEHIDLFVLVTVLHEIEDIPDFIAEINRVLKMNGRVLVIDFHKKKSDKGPDIRKRVSAYQGARHFLREGITLVEQYNISNQMYALILEKGVKELEL